VLRANAGTSMLYVLIVLAALLRVGAAFAPAYPSLLEASAICWAVAFLGFAALFGGMLVTPRLGARPARA